MQQPGSALQPGFMLCLAMCSLCSAWAPAQTTSRQLTTVTTYVTRSCSDRLPLDHAAGSPACVRHQQADPTAHVPRGHGSSGEARHHADILCHRYLST